MKLTTQSIIGLHGAMIALDAAAAKPPAEGERVRLGRELRWKLARNLRRTEAVVAAYDKVRTGLILEITGGANAVTAPADKGELLQLEAELMAERHEIELELVGRDELPEEGIAAVVLCGLAPMIRDAGEAPAAAVFATRRRPPARGEAALEGPARANYRNGAVPGESRTPPAAE